MGKKSEKQQKDKRETRTRNVVQLAKNNMHDRDSLTRSKQPLHGQIVIGVLACRRTHRGSRSPKEKITGSPGGYLFLFLPAEFRFYLKGPLLF